MRQPFEVLCVFFFRLSIIYAKFDEVAKSGDMVVNEPDGKDCSVCF